MPPWLSTLQSQGAEGSLENAAQSEPLGIDDGGEESGREDWGRGEGGLEEETRPFDERYGGDKEEEEWESEYRSRSDGDDVIMAEKRSGNVPRDVQKRRGQGERGAAQAGALKRPTMLDILEGGSAGGVGMGMGMGEREGGSEEPDDNDTLRIPPNMDEIMEEMRMLAQQDLDRKKQRHRHLGQQDEGTGDGEDEEGHGWEGEEDGWEGEEGWSGEEGGGEGGGGEEGVGRWPTASAGVDPEEQARALLEEMMTEAGSKGGRRKIDGELSPSAAPNGCETSTSGGISAGSDSGAERSLAGKQDERELRSMEELQGIDEGEMQHEDKEEVEYEDWTPLMHDGLKERTAALLGVVEMLEVDAMAAARLADAESGFGGGGAGAGLAVEAIMRARLKTLTEARRSKKAVRFIEEEFPKEVRRKGSR